MGPKGLNVLAITHEDRAQVLKYLAQGNPSDMTYTIGLGGLTLPNPTNGIPYAWLIDVDGKVVWQGHGVPPGKAIEGELKKVKMDAERKAVRAEKALAYAENLLAEKQVVRALRVLEDAKKEFKGTDAAKKAEERIGAVEKDESLKDEFAAQKVLDKLVTGLEQPKEKLKKKERESIDAKLERFIKDNEAKAPVAVETARMWRKVMTEDWADTAK